MKKNFTKQNLRDISKQLIELFRLFLPQDRAEWLLLILLLLFYSTYAFFITVNTSVIDNIAFKTDTFFSFDAPEIYEHGTQSMIPHPLMGYFLSPIIFIGDSFALIFGTYKAKTIVWTVFCLFFISMSSVYVRRYLKQIVELKSKATILITLLFSTTSTCLILCFTPESYTVSLFLITFTLWYYGYCMKKNKGVSFLTNFVLATLMGGITITNYALGTIPIFFSEKTYKKAIRKCIYIGISVFLIFLWLQLQYSFLFDVKTRFLYFTTPRGMYYEHAIDWFFGAALFFPKVIAYFNTVFDRNEYVVHMEFYHHWWQYLFVAIIAGTIIISIIRNYKNKHVQILSLFFGVSIFIHLIVKYGIDEPMIFGGHWVYIVPLLLGWLYKSLDGRKLQKYFYYFLILILIAQFANNMIEMNNFKDAALSIFPPV